jgi:hypothetical protein
VKQFVDTVHRMADTLSFPGASDFRVVRADPLHPPPIPAGAHAVEVRDGNGVTIGYSWAHPSVAHETLVDTAWQFADKIANPSRPVSDASDRRSRGDSLA